MAGQFAEALVQLSGLPSSAQDLAMRLGDQLVSRRTNHSFACNCLP